MTKEELEKEAEESAKQNCSMPINWNEIDVAERAGYVKGYIAGAKPRETRVVGLEAENEWIRTKYYELQDTLKKVRLALIKERTANIMNYGKGGVEMFDECFEILKGVSN